tara:strand:+ start:209 stop:823 length:615 start_codon:yes stop_codon:yes gene_type:complete
VSDIIKMGLLSGVIPVLDKKELIKSGKKAARKVVRELKVLRKKEKREKEAEENFVSASEAENFLNHNFNTEFLAKEVTNNSNKDEIIRHGLSDIIQKGIRFPGRLSRFNRAQNRIYKSLLPKQKSNYHNYLKALSIMEFGDSFLVEDWMIMSLLLFRGRQTKVRFHHILLSETTYRVWKLDDLHSPNTKSNEGNKEHEEKDGNK